MAGQPASGRFSWGPPGHLAQPHPSSTPPFPLPTQLHPFPRGTPCSSPRCLGLGSRATLRAAGACAPAGAGPRPLARRAGRGWVGELLLLGGCPAPGTWATGHGGLNYRPGAGPNLWPGKRRRRGRGGSCVYNGARALSARWPPRPHRRAQTVLLPGTAREGGGRKGHFQRRERVVGQCLELGSVDRASEVGQP